MTEVFVDSNVFLRYYVQDDARQSEDAEVIFRRALQREIDLVTGPPVFFEVAWTLKAWAKWPESRILETLEAMAAIPNMKLIDEDLVVAAILLARRSGQGFADAYIAVTASHRGARVATFNRKHFNKLDVDLYDC